MLIKMAHAMISVQDYEVPVGWTELKFFYKSELIWTVSQSDINF